MNTALSNTVNTPVSIRTLPIFKTERAIVTLDPTSPSFFILRVYHPKHGISPSFYVSLPKFSRWIEENDARGCMPYVEMDCDYVMKAYRTSDLTMTVTMYWTRVGSDSILFGYMQTFDLFVGDLEMMLLTRQKARLLTTLSRRVEQASITISRSAQHQIGRLSRPVRRALCKALRSCFQYGRESQVTLYADWHQDFGFSDGSINGGLCLHESTVTGKDGKQHKKLQYSVHT